MGPGNEMRIGAGCVRFNHNCFGVRGNAVRWLTMPDERTLPRWPATTKPAAALIPHRFRNIRGGYAEYLRREPGSHSRELCAADAAIVPRARRVRLSVPYRRRPWSAPDHVVRALCAV